MPFNVKTIDENSIYLPKNRKCTFFKTLSLIYILFSNNSLLYLYRKAVYYQKSARIKLGIESISDGVYTKHF